MEVDFAVCPRFPQSSSTRYGVQETATDNPLTHPAESMLIGQTLRRRRGWNVSRPVKSRHFFGSIHLASCSSRWVDALVLSPKNAGDLPNWGLA